MACPNSPEDGYHRFKLAPKGLMFATQCVYCGAAKLLRPFDLEDTVSRYRRRVTREPLVAPRRVIDIDRESAEIPALRPGGASGLSPRQARRSEARPERRAENHNV